MSDAPANAADGEPPGPRRPARLGGWPAAIALLAIHAGLGLGATLGKTVTFDEPAFLGAGLAAWTADRTDVEPSGGMVTQRWGALPLVLEGLSLPRQLAQPGAGFDAGQHAIFGERGRAERVLPRARAAMTLLSVALGAVVYLWSRRLFGRLGALVSLALFAFCPNFLANGPLVASDVPAALFFVATCGASWRVLHRVSPGSVLLAGLAGGGLCLSKMSAGIFVPVVAILIAVRLAVGRPLIVALPGYRRIVRTRGRQAAWLGAAAAGVLLATWACIWAGYGFRFAASAAVPNGASLDAQRWRDLTSTGSFVTRAIARARDLRLLPDAWLYGLAFSLARTGARLAFLNGEVGTAGWPWFFPYALLVKTPVATLTTLGAAAWAGAAGLRTAARGGLGRRWRWRGLYRTAPLWVLLAAYGAFAVMAHINIGVRHVLPVTAASFVLAGAAARRLARARPALRWAAAAMFLAVPLESMAVHPNYLTFFNVLAGGPRHGYEHLVDSSLDWGQDLPALARWLEERGLQGQDRIPVYLSYFGNGNARYYGLRATMLLGFSFPPQASSSLPPLRPGVYCISATLLQGVYWLAAPGTAWEPAQEWEYQGVSWALARARAAAAMPDVDENFVASLRMARLSHYLRTKEPEARINDTIFVYALGEDDLAAFDRVWPDGVPPRPSGSVDRASSPDRP